MHEASIVRDLIGLIEDELLTGAPNGTPSGVRAVRVRVGALSGVVPQALRFAFDAVAPGTIVQGARLDVEEVPATIHCAPCGEEHEVSSPQRMRCPVCGTPASDVVRGRELEIISLEVID